LPNPKSIRIFLADGVPNGLMIAEMGGRTGTFLVVPRSPNLLQVLKARPETARPGIYILIGLDDNSAVYREKVYIGESDDVLTRLGQHLIDSKKDFWNQTALIVSKDPNFNKTHAKYLEFRMIALAQAAGRATLANGNNSSMPYLSEADKADMENFLEEIQIVLPTLGFSFALPAPAVIPSGPSLPPGNPGGDPAKPPPIDNGPPTVISVSPLFVLNGSGLTAQAQIINGEFVVLKGSDVSSATKPSLRQGMQNLRVQLLNEGKINDYVAGGNLQFSANVPFNSPSAASDVILGYSSSGPASWKVKDTGQTYKDWQIAQSAQVLNSSSENPTDTNS
jgi:hypothetical protein